MTVYAIKLVSGEELVGEVVESTPTELKVKNVLMVGMQATEDGQRGLGFFPFMPYLGKNKIITIKLDKAIVSEEVDDTMRNHYNSIFGGVITPSKELILG